MARCDDQEATKIRKPLQQLQGLLLCGPELRELKEEIEDGSTGFPEAEPIEPGGPDPSYFIFAG